MAIKRLTKTIFMIIFSLATAMALLNENTLMEAAAKETELHKTAAEIVQTMTIEEKIGQMFMIDFPKSQGNDVTVINEAAVETLRKYAPGGIILFEENTVDALQTKCLTGDLQSNSPKIPLFIAIDQEGGAVTRLKYATIMPGNMALGAINDKRIAYQVAKTVGKELSALGFNLNFAPVIDINNNPDNPVIGVRAFSADPEMVTELGLSYMKGLNDARIISAVKHFPGHGDTGVDSHIDLPIVPHAMERLDTFELKPYYAMIEKDIPMIMTAHVTFPAIEEREGIPATLSSNCLTGLLREKMGFRGVIITDALNMKAITKRFGESQAAEMAILAGADMLLMPPELEKTFDYILNQVTGGRIPVARIDASVMRILELKLKKGIIGPKKTFSAENLLKIISSKKTVALKKKAAAKAVTLVRNEANTLPYKLTSSQKIVFFAPSRKGEESVHEALNSIIRESRIDIMPVTGFNYENLKSITPEQKRVIDKSDCIILFTRTVKADDLAPKRSYIASFAAELTAYAVSADKKIVAIAIRNPYDIQFMPEVNAYITAYSDWYGGGVEASLKLVFGMLNPAGKLPVALPDKDGTILYPCGFGITSL